MRHLAVCIGAVIGFALLPACGKDETARMLRVEIVGASADGVVPASGWRLRSESGTEKRLVENGRGTQGAILALSAEAGRYSLLGPGEWSMLGGPKPLALQPGLPPVAVAVGRKGRIYLVPPEGARIAEIVVDDETSPKAPPLDVKYEVGDDRRAVLQRLGEGWPTRIRINVSFEEGTLASLARLVPPADGAPTGAPLERTPVFPLELRLVPLGASGLDPSATLASTFVRGRLRAKGPAVKLSSSGVVAYPAFPATVDAAEWKLGEWSSWMVPADVLSEGVVRLAADPGFSPGITQAHALGQVMVRITKPADAPPGFLQIRPIASAAFGILEVPELASSPEWPLLLPDGMYAFTYRAGSLGAVPSEPVEVKTGGTTRVNLDLVPLCRVAVAFEGGVRSGQRLRIAARRIEGDKAVLAAGYEKRNLARTDTELELPPGTYRLTASDDLHDGPALDLVLEQPGMRASVRLTPPR